MRQHIKILIILFLIITSYSYSQNKIQQKVTIEDVQKELKQFYKTFKSVHSETESKIEELNKRIKVLEGLTTEEETEEESSITEINVTSYDWGNFVSPPGEPNPTNDLMRVSPDGVGFYTNKYASHAAFNSDDTLFKLSTQYGTAIHDAQTGDFLYYTSAPNFGHWSNTNPDLMYGVTSGTNQFKKHVPSSNRTTVLRTFSNYSSISIGHGEGKIDNNDQYVCLIGGNDLIVYDIKQNIIKAVKSLPGGDLDWASVTQSGEYVVLSWRQDGSAYNQGLKRLTLDLTNETHLTNYTAHADLGIDVNGDDVYLGLTGLGGKNLIMVRIKDGYTAVSGNNIKVYGGHVSARNTKKHGWAFISESCCPANGRPSLDVFPLKLDYTFDTIGEPVRTYAFPLSGQESSPMACPSRYGDMIIFNSNWNDSNLKQLRYAPAWLKKY